MARKPRVQFEGAMYHVMTRGNRRERIVKDDTDYGMLNKMMFEAMNWSGVKLYSWCPMPNHAHVLVETPDGNLAEFMQRWLTRYARYFNWRHGLVGHVFQGRYTAKLCQKDAYFKQLIRYIHLNPHKVKTPGFVGPEGWKWSSHRYYMGQQAPEGCQRAIDEGLSWFGQDPTTARMEYTKFLADGLKDGNWEDFYKGVHGDVLGGAQLQERFRKETEEPRKAKRRLSVKWTLEEILMAAERSFQLDRKELASASQGRRLSRVRQAVALVARKEALITTTEVANALDRDISAVSQMIRRWEGKTCKEADQLIETLSKLSNCQA